MLELNEMLQVAAMAFWIMATFSGTWGGCEPTTSW